MNHNFCVFVLWPTQWTRRDRFRLFEGAQLAFMAVWGASYKFCFHINVHIRGYKPNNTMTIVLKRQKIIIVWQFTSLT